MVKHLMVKQFYEGVGPLSLSVQELDLEENRPVSEVASKLDLLEGELDECRHELENLMRQHYNPPGRSWNTCLSG